ncbi:MAG: hypothetical protein CVU65_11290 [Deltaproteobacteria bacterium HGW-Deltaproteobacteria-22]|nr:MAG: hypothetical protein CVU65_11290 [Deltaproteobacteria bacterium HGW-Deltaproteobacteria-22]
MIRPHRDPSSDRRPQSTSPAESGKFRRNLENSAWRSHPGFTRRRRCRCRCHRRRRRCHRRCHRRRRRRRRRH